MLIGHDQLNSLKCFSSRGRNSCLSFWTEWERKELAAHTESGGGTPRVAPPPSNGISFRAGVPTRLGISTVFLLDWIYSEIVGGNTAGKIDALTRKLKIRRTIEFDLPIGRTSTLVVNQEYLKIDRSIELPLHSLIDETSMDKQINLKAREGRFCSNVLAIFFWIACWLVQPLIYFDFQSLAESVRRRPFNSSHLFSVVWFKSCASQKVPRCDEQWSSLKFEMQCGFQNDWHRKRYELDFIQHILTCILEWEIPYLDECSGTFSVKTGTHINTCNTCCFTWVF